MIKRINNSSKLGIIALSSPCDPNLLRLGILELQNRGFSVKVALDPTKAYGLYTDLFSSDSPKARAAALHELFVDTSIDAIFCARGAYGCMELLPLIDFDLIAKHPKALIGFSDLTALLIACQNKSNITCFHGPMISGAFAQASKDALAKQSVDHCLELLMNQKSFTLTGVSLSARVEKQTLQKNKALLTGGSLTMICALMGTPWEIETDQRILFLEDTGEKPYQVHRMLMQLKLAGKFDSIKGVLLGDFGSDLVSRGPGLTAVFNDIFSSLNIPVLRALSFGHSALNYTIPLNGWAVIEGTQVQISI